MSYEMKGHVLLISDTQQITEKFKKREFVLEFQDGAYQKPIKFQLLQDKTELINGVSIGDEIKVFFNIDGTAWTNKQGDVNYFVNLNCWKIEKSNTGTPQNSGFGEPVTIPQKSQQDDFVGDDLPF